MNITPAQRTAILVKGTNSLTTKMTTFTRLLPAQVGPLFPLGRRHLSSENVDQTNDLGPEVGTRTRVSVSYVSSWRG